MANFNLEQLKSLVIEVLVNVPNAPFLCLPMSALLYANLLDRYQVKSKLVTGNLVYKGQYIFKQDFSISDTQDSKFREWSGHAWVELEDMIIDLSFFRTLYSDAFTKAVIKNEIIRQFGVGRGTLIASSEQLENVGMEYKLIDTLTDIQATSIIAGYKVLLDKKNVK